MTITEHRCAADDENPNIISACHPALLCRDPSGPERQESSVLAAWTVLLRDQYALDSASFAHLQQKEDPPDKSSKILLENLRSQHLSVSIITDATGEQLKNAASKAVDIGEWGGLASTKAKTAVLVLSNEQINGLSQVLELLEVELLLVIAISNDRIMANLYSNGFKRPELKPCAVLKSFKNIHQTLAFQADVKIGDISTVTPLDIERLYQVNGTKKVHDDRSPQCLHVLINRHYSRYPETIALASTSLNITYAELGKRSAAIAHFLTNKGIRPGDTVGLCLDRSVWTIIVVIGILRTGAAYAPMDSSYPLGRISQIVERADVQCVVTDDKLRRKLQDLKAELVTLAELQEAEVPKEWLEEANVDASKPAYFMFTSGSTGVPKGVIHGHATVSASLLECVEEFQIDNSTRYMQSASLSFDASILEIFAPLVVGGCLCVISQEERNSDLESVMRGLKISHAWLTPSMTPQIRPENVPDLRSLGIGGELPSAGLLSIWGDRVQLHNMYGTTEAGVWDTVKKGIKAGDNPRNIGRGIGNVACWITDPSNVHRLMPFGAEGELLIQSPHLALGYLKDPDRQAKALLDPSSLEWAPFIPNIEGSRVYRTGDLAKYNEHGEIIFLGRQTGYVKIRGLRVDLGEVENAIDSCLKTGRSAVALSEHEDEGCNIEIVAFIETNDYQEDQLAEGVHDQLSKFLPTYMIPTLFVPISSMPLTLSKKIDRQQLRSRLLQMSQKGLQSFRKGGLSLGDCPQIPETKAIAREISNIIADMLETKDQEFAVSVRGKDFSLISVGLTSMQLVSLVNSIRKRYQKKLNIEDLQNSDVTVCNIEDYLLGEKTLKKKASQARNLMADLAKLKPKLDFIRIRQATVFLTSITGFLGSQILRSLLEHPEIGCVIGLVRAKDEEQARKKVQQHAELGRWWQPEYQDRIEFWIGDLSKPKIGLDESKWNRLFATDTIERIDGIIHNGARVNWMDSYEDLELVNIHSTIDILSGLSKMGSPCTLIYVSGGYMPMKPETHGQIARKLAEASGYDQTKFMSQLLLTEYNKHLAQKDTKAEKSRTVIPGFIVGTQKEGIAHTEDFLWRLAFSIIRLKAVSNDLHYITVAGVDQVANLIADVFLQPDQYSSEAINCVDGVRVSTFCDVLSKQMQMPIERMDHEAWMQLLRADIAEADFDHPFMPVLRWFEENIWQFMGDKDSIPENCYFDQMETIVALESSVRYLMDVGYLSHSEPSHEKLDKTAVFSRSSS
ncbi:unnamed protein product [Penicillium glandicola]